MKTSHPINLTRELDLHKIILASISDAVFITDIDGNFTYICPNVSTIFGYSYDETLQAGNIEKLLGPQLFSVAHLKKCGEIANIEHTISDKYGKKHSLLVNAKFVSIEHGNILYTCRDFTERKSAENSLNKTRKLLRTRLRYEKYISECSRVVLLSKGTFPIQDCLKLLKKAAHTRSAVYYDAENSCEFFSDNISDITIASLYEKNKSLLRKGTSVTCPTETGKILILPVMVFSSLQGMLAFTGGKSRIWKTEDIRMLKTAAEIIGSAKEQQIMAQTLEKKRLKSEKYSHALKKLSSQLMDAVEKERKRIATDIHDEVGAMSVAVCSYLAIAEQQIQNNNPKSMETLQTSRKMLQNSIEYLKKTAFTLRPPEMEILGVQNYIEKYLKAFSETTGIKSEFICTKKEIFIGETASITLYRICQESLSNIFKHSQTNKITVRMRVEKDLHLSISSDSAKIFSDPDWPYSIGIIGMKERAAACDGVLNITVHDKGSELNLTIRRWHD